LVVARRLVCAWGRAACAGITRTVGARWACAFGCPFSAASLRQASFDRRDFARDPTRRCRGSMAFDRRRRAFGPYLRRLDRRRRRQLSVRGPRRPDEFLRPPGCLRQRRRDDRERGVVAGPSRAAFRPNRAGCSSRGMRNRSRRMSRG
jgi:hypothetical protein